MNIAVIFAGGIGQRMQTATLPKQFLELHGKPIIIYTLEHFEKHQQIDAIVIACVEEWIPYLQQMIDKFHITKVRAIVPGGQTGQMSIYNGLVAAREYAEGCANGQGDEQKKSQADKMKNSQTKEQAESCVVLIHDGVRPMINDQLITDNIAMVRAHGSAITSAIVKETIMVVDEDDSINYVAPRRQSRVAKAPQSFWLNDILNAHEKAQQEGEVDFIDSCTMMQHYGHKLYLVDGPLENIKVTTPDDFYTLRALLDAKENEQIYVLKNTDNC